MSITVELAPNGIDTDNANWTSYTGSGTKHGVLADEDDGTGIVSSTALQAILFTYEDMTIASTVFMSRVVIVGRLAMEISGEVGFQFKSGGTTVSQAMVEPTDSISVTTVEHEWDITLLKPGGGQWSAADINALSAGVAETNWNSPGGSSPVLWRQRIRVTYAEIPQQLAASREVATRELLARRRLRQMPTGTVPLSWLDLQLGDPYLVVHQDLPTADGLGGQRAKKWTQLLVRHEGVDLDLENLTVTVEGAALRNYLRHLWDTARADSAGPLQDGVALLDNGQVRTFNRDSMAWVEDPSDGRVVAVNVDIDAIARDGRISPTGSCGRLFEDESKNYIQRSSFVSGNTGLTDTGEGYNGSNIDVVEYGDWAPPHIFDPLVTRYYCQFTGWTAGSPAPAHLRRAWATDTVPGDATVGVPRRGTISIDWYSTDPALSPFGLWIKRNVDNLWWTGSAWGAETRLGIPGLTSGVRGSTSFDIGSADTAFTVYIGYDAAAANGLSSRVYHVQLEVAVVDRMSSRIVTGAAGVTRAASTLSYSNNNGNRIWPASRGTLLVKVALASVIAGTLPTILYAYHDANNYAWLYYDRSNTRWVFELKVAGNISRATWSATPVAGTEYSLAARWCGSLGEWDLAAYTISVFLNGVKGTDAVPAASMTEQATANLYLGHKNGSEFLFGTYADLEITDQVFSDTEIARFS